MRRLDYIAHNGIKGMKWYHRRFQNKDGSLTPEGRERYGVGKKQRAVNDIISTLSNDELNKLGISDHDNPQLSYDEGYKLIKRVLKSVGDLPVSVFDLVENETEGDIYTVVATRSDPKYRGKGYAKKAAKQGLDWYEKNKHRFNYDRIYWGVRTDNAASIQIAKDLGFKKEFMGGWRDPDDKTTWSSYYRKVR